MEHRLRCIIAHSLLSWLPVVPLVPRSPLDLTHEFHHEFDSVRGLEREVQDRFYLIVGQEQRLFQESFEHRAAANEPVRPLLAFKLLCFPDKNLFLVLQFPEPGFCALALGLELFDFVFFGLGYG